MTSSLPNGMQGSSYAATLTASGGTTPYSWSLASGSSLPAGLTLAASTGKISGTPSQSGTYTFTIQVADPGTTPQSATQSYTVTMAASGPQPLTITTSSLPNGTQGSSYSATLTANGGTTPYSWSLASGSSLPAGLTLAGSGKISGTPSQSGTYTFTIQVADSSATPQSTTHSYTVTIAATPPPPSPLTITTSSLPNGTTGANYAQSLAATGGTTPYTWSLFSGVLPQGLALGASTGIISGIPTQAGSYSFTIQVQDSETTPQTAKQAFGVTIGASPLVISTASLPSGVVATAYSATLSAAGGSAPYTWSVLSGSLPAGLTLSTGGVISGTPTTAAISSFQVQVKDSAGTTASGSFSINVVAAGSCGGPITYCSRTDLTTVQLPNPIPSLGNLVGANTIITDPDFGNRIVRVTDAQTDPASPNITYAIGVDGSADTNAFNTDSTLFVTDNSNAKHHLFAFDPATMQVSRPYGSSYTVGRGMFSHLNPNIYYQVSGLQIQKLDFTNRTSPPTPQLVADFTSGSNCLPTGYSATWTDFGGLSPDDSIFAAAFSNSGGQGTGVDVVVWKVGSGCIHWNTSTGQITGDWGVVGTITSPYRLQLHNIKIGTGGTWLVAVSSSSTGGSGPFFWNIGTLTVTACGTNCGGHWIGGFSNWINNSTGAMHQLFRPFADPASGLELISNFPATLPNSNMDEHQSWNNNSDGTDTQPFFTTTFGTTTPYPSAWYQEVMGITNSGTVYRFAHMFNTSLSQRFSTRDGIGTVSQDGKWFAFSSDWMGTLGSESGGSTCTVGTNCRGDAFIIELK